MLVRGLPLLWLRNMAPPRRSSDNEEADYRNDRRAGGPFNGHTKWIVGVVGGLIVTALVTLASRDRASIDREQTDQNGRISKVESAVTNLAQLVVANSATDEAFRQEIRASLAEIKADIKDVKREVRQ